MPPRRTAFTVNVAGLAQFSRELRDVSKELPKDLRKANKEAAEVVATEARKRAPVVSGRLKASIKAGASSRSAYVKAGTPGRVPYALPIEFGWPSRNIEAQPFVYPAIAAKNEQVIEEYDRLIGELLAKIFND